MDGAGLVLDGDIETREVRLWPQCDNDLDGFGLQGRPFEGRWSIGFLSLYEPHRSNAVCRPICMLYCPPVNTSPIRWSYEEWHVRK